MNKDLGDEFMKKSYSAKKVLKIILDISYWASIIGILIGIPTGICIISDKNPQISNIVTVKVLFFSFVGCIIYAIMINELRQIVNRIIKVTPFTIENVKGFRKISKCIVIFCIVDFIDSIMNDKFLIVFNRTSPMKLDIITYLILAGTTLVIAEVLEKAIEIKSENDLTI